MNIDPSSDAKVHHLRTFIEEQRLRIALLESHLKSSGMTLPAESSLFHEMEHAGNTKQLQSQLLQYALDFEKLLERQEEVEKHSQVARQRLELEMQVERTRRQNQDREMLGYLVRALLERYPFLRDQLEKTRKWARVIAQELRWEPESVSGLVEVVDIVDLGMLAFPDGIFADTGKPTGVQWDSIARHPELSCQMTFQTQLGRTHSKTIRHHHERFDGRGFPDGIAGDAIPMSARIIAVANAFAAMTTERPFRSPMDRWTARMEIKDGSETAFDPKVVSAFLRAFDAGLVPVE